MLWKYIKTNMMQHPGKELKEENYALTYEETVIFAENFAKRLTSSCYVILCHSELGCALALLSCFAAGVTAVPLSYRYGEKHCKRILDFLKPQYAISDMNGELQVVEINGGNYEEPEVNPALLMFTSGTTGTPKGIMLSQKNIITNVSDILKYFTISDKDRILIMRPLYHSAVLTGEFIVSLVKGLDIIFCNKNFNPNDILKLIDDESISVMCGTPSLLSMLSRFTNKPSSLKNIVVSGECMPASAAPAIRSFAPEADIFNVYGLTEASPRVAYLPPEYFDIYPSFVGVPLASVKAKTVNKKGRKTAPGEEGELAVRGGNIMLGYYKDPKHTKKVLRGGWLYTGDIAVIDEKGFIEIKGRRDNMIIKAGMNIYPSEIENTLKEDSRVDEVIAYGVSDRYTGQSVSIKIKGDFADTSEVMELCVKTLPLYERPSHIELTDNIPKTASGKVIRSKK